MAVLEGDERSQMPSISWSSVVRSRTRDVVERSAAERSGVEEQPTPEDEVEPTAAVDVPAIAAVAFSTPSVAPDRPVAAPPIAPIAPAAAPPGPAPLLSAPSPSMAAADGVGPEPRALSIPDIDDQLDHTSQPIMVSSARTTPIVARVPGATLAVPASSTPADREALPEIIEATPTSTITSQIAVIGGGTAATSPVIEPVSDASVPSIPDPVTAPAPTVPVAAAQVAEPAQLFEPTPAIIPTTHPSQSPTLPPVIATAPRPVHEISCAQPATRPLRKDRTGSIARVGFFFLIVAALGSAAVIFGRPFLFPADWEANALEFAEPIEVARGTDFIEPVLLTAQPTDVHRAMVAAQLLGDPASSLALWRALGLAGPDSTDDATLQALISETSPVLYSTVDGQVYYDEAFTRSDRSALITRAMATAALDQEYSFSTEEAARSLDDAALTEAHVRQQSTLIEQKVSSGASLPTSDLAALAYLPAVLDYRLTAPVVFEQLLPPVNDVAANPLVGIGTTGPGPLIGAPIGVIVGTSAAVGDTPVGPAVVTDRSFWYLSFASHLDASTAYRMSAQLSGVGLQMVDGPTGRCAVATLATADAATNATLQADLAGWVAGSAPELGATVTTLPDSSVQLRSCDPAGAYTSNIRFGVARQLIAWRSVELAVTNLVVASGGTDVDVAAAVGRIGSTPSAAAVAQLPAGTNPAEVAAAAQAAADDVVASAPVPAPIAPDPGITGEG